ncbi:thrombospondin type 1 domain protein [Oesophagostomum dentatum]|uniref:Thrombospondin type 1 domain protein n=1 Tax=Oesophagostomum dentatum TaxID=61180 RepID=A0A0B1SFJ2_OESDE|nr:thrombospondin type 1 domain protein [Oesophagostomum dentatum]
MWEFVGTGFASVFKMFFTALVLSLLQAASSYVIGTGVVPGAWSQWSEWSTCTTVVGVMSQTRTRTCSVATCTGDSYSESRPCTTYIPPPVPPPPIAVPQWSEWGPWGTCSVSCGGGIAQRTRMCVDPCTNCCLGVDTETQPCNTQPCCEWSSWGPWSRCSVTCGAGGVTYRTRQCSCPEGVSSWILITKMLISLGLI